MAATGAHLTLLSRIIHSLFLLVVSYLNNSKDVFNYVVGSRGEDFEFDDCKHVVKCICPSWIDIKNDEITVKIICGGITNRLYRLIHKDQSVLVRLYGENTEVFIDRQSDNGNITTNDNVKRRTPVHDAVVDTFAELSRCGYAPTYYGRFTNGRIEGWVDGVALEPHQLGQTEPHDFVSLIAKELGKLHAMEIMKSDDSVVPCLWTVRLKKHVYIAASVMILSIETPNV
jgi:ethanolamine kinase